MQPTVDASVETQGRGEPHPKLNKYSIVGLSYPIGSSLRCLSKPPGPIVYKLCSMKAGALDGWINRIFSYRCKEYLITLNSFIHWSF